MSKCDFCEVELTSPVWDYPCNDFVIEALFHNPITGEPETKTFYFTGPWASCEICYQMIEAGNPDFHKYQAQRLAAKRGDQPDSLDLQLVTAIFQGFTEHRVGPPVPSAP